MLLENNETTGSANSSSICEFGCGGRSTMHIWPCVSVFWKVRLVLQHICSNYGHELPGSFLTRRAESACHDKISLSDLSPYSLVLIFLHMSTIISVVFVKARLLQWKYPKSQKNVNISVFLRFQRFYPSLDGSFHLSRKSVTRAMSLLPLTWKQIASGRGSHHMPSHSTDFDWFFYTN